MLRNVSIKKKGAAVIALPLLLTVALLGTLYSIGNALNDAIAATLRSQEVLNAIDVVQGRLVAVHAETLRQTLLGTSPTTATTDDRQVLDGIDRLRSLATSSTRQASLVEQFAPRAKALLADLEDTCAQLSAGQLASAATRAATNDAALREVAELADQLRREERQFVLHRFQLAGQVSDRWRIALFAGSFLAVVLLGLVAASLLRSMLGRMLVVEANVERLAADEDLLPPIPAQDEIGRIDHAVHDMVRTLRAQRVENEMFIYSVSHDLRSPLVNLQGFSKELTRSVGELQDALAHGSLLPPVRSTVDRITTNDMPEALRYIDLAVKRQAGIIESLLALSRAGRVEYRFTNVDIMRSVQSLVAEMGQREGLPEVEFRVGRLPPVRGDRLALERVFGNLLSNSLHYLAPGRKGQIEVGALATQDPSTTTLFVRDNGIGIAQENHDKVFSPFARFAGGKGEGIGLSLVRRVVDRHHGRVWIESEPNVGTTVFVALPTTENGTTPTLEKE